jgi:hypothetical protein
MNCTYTQNICTIGFGVTLSGVLRVVVDHGGVVVLVQGRRQVKELFIDGKLVPGRGSSKGIVMSIWQPGLDLAFLGRGGFLLADVSI